jgi:phage terminase small subunit
MPKKKKKLSAEEKEFCALFVEYRNGARASREAGFDVKNHRQKAAELLTNPYISEEINRVEKEIENRAGAYNVAQIVEQLTQAATVDPFQYFEMKGRALFLKDETEIPPEVARLIEEIHVTPDGIKVKLIRKGQALDMLAKILGAYEKDNAQKRPEKSKVEKVAETLTDEEIKKMLGL